MTDNTCLATNHYIAAYFGATTNAGLCSNYGIASYFYIVRNLDEVIELGTFMNDSRTNGGAVNG